jgi:hypothetical protein
MERKKQQQQKPEQEENNVLQRWRLAFTNHRW